MDQIYKVMIAIGIIISAFLTRIQHLFLNLVFLYWEIFKLRYERAEFFLFTIIVIYLGGQTLLHFIYANYLDTVLVNKVSEIYWEKQFAPFNAGDSC